MTRLFDWLFGLDRLRLSEAGVEFGFAHRVPAWAWALSGVIALALVVWGYYRLDGKARWRGMLAGVRWVIIMALAVLAAGPQLIRANERNEPDWILVLADRSGSMAIPDAPLPDPLNPAARATRERQLQEALGIAWPALSKASADRRVVWQGFDAGVYDLNLMPPVTGERTPGGLGEPKGRQTAIGRAMSASLAKAAARPVAGVVLLSDGQSVDEVDRLTLARLKADQIPVLVWPLGSAQAVEDLSVSGLQAPGLAFVNDTVPVVVEIQRSGGEAGVGVPARGVVELVDAATNEVLDAKSIPQDPSAWRDGKSAVTMLTTPRVAERVVWVARVRPETPDLIQENNEQRAGVDLVDRPLRVLYVDGYPRWEYRYLKNLLLRERSIESVSTILAPNRRFIQEASAGEGIAVELPRTAEEWAKYDVVILGDVSPSVFSESQLEALKTQVAKRGVGLLWIAGPGATPSAWRDTALADLVPFSMSLANAIRPFDGPIVMRAEPAATGLGLLRLSDNPSEPWPARLSDPATGWSRLYGAQRIERDSLKPTAEVLASAIVGAGAGTGAEATPLVIAMRFGAGRVLYVGTDEIWRWRYARGETLPERFWLPLLRLQGRESLAQAARPASLEASPRRGSVGQPVQLSLRLSDQSVIDTLPAEHKSALVRVARRVDPSGAGGDVGPVEIKLALEAGSAGSEGGTRRYTGTFIADEPGSYVATLSDAMMPGVAAAVEFQVVSDDDEMRRPSADHAYLERLAKESGGRVLTAEELARVDALMPRRDLRVATTPDVEPLWDRPFVLALLLALLTLEWVGRRLVKLI